MPVTGTPRARSGTANPAGTDGELEGRTRTGQPRQEVHRRLEDVGREHVGGVVVVALRSLLVPQFAAGHGRTSRTTAASSRFRAASRLQSTSAVTRRSHEQPARHRSTGGGRIVLATMLLVLLVESIATVAVAGWWHYQKVYLVPDYVAGYDMGSQWRSERVEDDCAEGSQRALPARQHTALARVPRRVRGRSSGHPCGRLEPSFATPGRLNPNRRELPGSWSSARTFGTGSWVGLGAAWTVISGRSGESSCGW